MNLQEYIASGILESYVVGDLNDHDRAEVEDNLRQYPELRQELAKIEQAHEAILLRAAVDPPVAAKQKVMAKISSRDTSPPAEPAPVVPAWWKYAAAAILAVALVNGYLAYNYHARWQQSQQEVDELISQNQQLALDRNRMEQVLDTTVGTLSILSDPSFRKILLNGTENSPQSLAQVFWNPTTNEVYLDVETLTALPSDRQYQLWAIVEGTPVDAGVFDAGEQLLKMKNVARANAFAVTIEPKGGSENPSLETLQVIGNT